MVVREDVGHSLPIEMVIIGLSFLFFTFDKRLSYLLAGDVSHLTSLTFRTSALTSATKSVAPFRIIVEIYPVPGQMPGYIEQIRIVQELLLITAFASNTVQNLKRSLARRIFLFSVEAAIALGIIPFRGILDVEIRTCFDFLVSGLYQRLWL